MYGRCSCRQSPLLRGNYEGWFHPLYMQMGQNRKTCISYFSGPQNVSGNQSNRGRTRKNIYFLYIFYFLIFSVYGLTFRSSDFFRNTYLLFNFKSWCGFWKYTNQSICNISVSRIWYRYILVYKLVNWYYSNFGESEFYIRLAKYPRAALRP